MEISFNSIWTKFKGVLSPKTYKCPYCTKRLEVPTQYEETLQLPKCTHTNCNRELPINFFDGDSSKLIVIIGSTDSGKSTFMTVLAKQLIDTNALNVVSKHCNADIPMETDKKQHLRNVGDLYHKLETLDTTTRKSSILVRIKNKNQTLFLSMHDAPGEDMRTLSKLAEKTEITRADGIICILDPFNIHILFDEIKQLPIYQRVKPIRFDIYQEITHIFDTLKAAGRVKNKDKVSIPVAFCLSKIDIIKSIIGLELPEGIDGATMQLSDALEAAELGRIRLEEQLNFLGGIQGDERLMNTIKSYFSNYGIFPISALGLENREHVGATLKEVPKPIGVEYPLLWMLRKLKFI